MIQTKTDVKYKTVNLCLFVFIIGTAGITLQVIGLNWDITMHLHRQPGGERLLVDAETFLSPTHKVLYLGVALVAISATMGAMLVLKLGKNQLAGKSFTFAFKLLLIGTALQLIAGPSDLWWHKTFGLDGLLSPTHLTLLAGMLVNSVAVILGLVDISKYVIPSQVTNMKLIKYTMIFGFVALWFSSTWFIYAFALPVSKGERIDNNLNPTWAILIAIMVIPLQDTLLFLTASKTISRFNGGNNRFGFCSALGAVFIIINVFANIIPSKGLTEFLPWYFIVSSALVIVADASLNLSLSNRQIISSKGGDRYNRLRVPLAGALFGSGFYILNFPMIVLTFAVFFGFPLRMLIVNESSNFINTLTGSLILTVPVGTTMGLIGAFIIMKLKNRSILKSGTTIKINSNDSVKGKIDKS